MAKRTEGDALDALSLEVERRRKLPGNHQYSYGKLIADTTEAQRKEIVDKYRRGHRRSDGRRASVYQESDDEADLQKITEQLESDIL